MRDSILTTDRHSFESRVRDSDRPVVVQFRADWCDRCRELAPVVEQLADAHEETVRLMTVDIEEESRLANAYHIAELPTFLGCHHGNTLRRISNGLNADDLEALFDYLAGLPLVSSS